MTFAPSIHTFLNLRQLLAGATPLHSGESAAALPEANTNGAQQ